MYWKSFTIHKPTKQPNQNTIHKPTKQPNQTEMFRTKMDELRWDHAFFNVDGSSHCTILTAPGCWCSTLDVFRWLLLNLLAGDIVQSWLHRAVDAQHWLHIIQHWTFSAGCCLTFWWHCMLPLWCIMNSLVFLCYWLAFMPTATHFKWSRTTRTLTGTSRGSTWYMSTMNARGYLLPSLSSSTSTCCSCGVRGIVTIAPCHLTSVSMLGLLYTFVSQGLH